MKHKVVIFLLFFVALGSALSGQKRNTKITITGFVVDENSYPVANAIILIDNQPTEIVTKENGFYRVKVDPSAQNIGVSTYILGVGEEPIISEEPINGLKRINFTLTASVARQMFNTKNSPGEQEINIGYGSIKRKDKTGFVSKLDGSDSKYATYTSIYEMLRDVPGLQVNGNTIQIHGPNSVLSDTEPLYLVDGTYTNSIDYIAPMSVKSIEVLKGASASIYGSRGANGVILINLLPNFY